MSIQSGYAKVVKFVMRKDHQLLVDATVLAFSFYLAFKKALGWSLTTALMAVFQIGLIEKIITFLLVVCLYASFMKLFTMVIGVFPATRMLLSKAEHLAHCCLQINNEIAGHVKRIISHPPSIKATFLDNHNFDRNIGLVADGMANHMLATLKDATPKDIFVSVYKVQNFQDFTQPRDRLHYICHFPPKRDAVVSKEVILDDAKFEKYECVQCVKSPATTRLITDCVEYYKSASKRHKKIKHYAGLKLMSGENLLGFVNIEFYNSSFFHSDDELSDFVEENLLSFRYLMEYQFLKASFFHLVHPRLA